ncbi:MAG TPA: sigma-70 family RNA polymerase sigma factor [Acidimicrobiales bacterium]|nr:sigma-70 family RNA polymerase sigma factor [Acidimicrobiales bacterium]
MEPPGNPDRQLVRRVLDGDLQAFPELVRRHDDRLRGLAYKLLGGDRDRMDDVMQEAYVRAYRSLDRFRGDADLGTWLYRIVSNACMDELRRGRRRPEPVDTSTWVAATARTGPEGAAAAADQVLRALRRLPDDQRLTVVLVDGEGFDHEEAARLLGVAPGTVASRLSRARATLRRSIESEQEEER